jgi:hypothetical protein
MNSRCSDHPPPNSSFVAPVRVFEARNDGRRNGLGKDRIRKIALAASAATAMAEVYHLVIHCTLTYGSCKPSLSLRVAMLDVFS